MKQVSIAELEKYIGKKVTIKGWVNKIRSSGKIWFLLLRDGTGLLQCVVVKKEVNEEEFKKEDILTQESSVIVTGTIRKEARAVGSVEMGIETINIQQIAEEYPISPKDHGPAFLMDNRHLWIRSRKQFAILKIRHEVVRSAREFLDKNGFTLVDSPMFTANAVEGTTSLFELDYFGRSAYLTQSGQLYAEASAMAFGKVYCFGPTFRAEKSKTRRHLTEFWMLEPEIAYCDLNQNMVWAEKLIQVIIESCLKNCKIEFEILDRDLLKLQKIKTPYPRITYDEAVEILHRNGVEFEYGSDFGSSEETILAEQFDTPFMIHRWPFEIKAFYMKRDPLNDKLALGVDVLAPEGYGEIVGGGQREEDHDTLVKRILKQDLPMTPFNWYLDLRKYGTVPHSGFGMGLERMVAWITGTRHIRETIPFPRTLSRLEP
jgi:asparaginyl-tRNA synthetase